MRAPWFASALSFIFALGCRAPESIFFEGPSRDALLLVVVVNGSGELVSVDQRFGDDALFVDVADDHRVVMFTLRREQFIDASGLEIDLARWPQVRATPASVVVTEPGGCGRCLVPVLGVPQVVSPGDACAVPGFAEARVFQATEGTFTEVVDQDLIDFTRGAIRLNWPGPCACDTPSASMPVPPPSVFSCALGGPESVEMRAAVALDDGAVLGLGPGYVVRVAANGEVQTRAINPSMRELDAALPILGAARVLVISGFAFDPAGSVWIVEPDLSAHPLRGLPPGFEPRAALHRAAGEPVHFIGYWRAAIDELPAALDCSIEADGSANCATVRVDPAGCTSERRAGLTELVATRDGHLVAITEDLRVYLRPRGADHFRCVDDQLAVPIALTSTLTIDARPDGRLGSVGNRVFLCLAGHSGGAERDNVMGFLSATVSTATSGSSSGEVSLSSFALAWASGEDGVGCLQPGLAFDAERLVFSVDRGGRRWLMAIDQGGGVESLGPHDGERRAFPELPSLGALFPGSGYELLAITEPGELYRRPATSESPFLPVVALPIERAYPASVVVQHPEGGFAVFRAGELPQRIRYRDEAAACEGFELETLSIEAFMEEAFHPEAAVSASNGAVAVYGQSQGELVVRTVDLAGGRFSSERLGPFPASIERVVQLSTDRRLLLSTEGRLYLHRPGRLELIQGTEERPPPMPGGLNLPPWHAIDAAGGVAWAAGPAGLARVVPAAEGGVTFEADWLQRARDSEFDGLFRREPPRPIGVRADCADRVVLAVAEELDPSPQSGSSALSLWSVSPEIPDALRLREHPALDHRSEALPLSPVRCVDIVGDPSGLNFAFLEPVHRASSVYRHGAPPLKLPFSSVQRLHRDGNVFLATGRYGRLAAFVEPR